MVLVDQHAAHERVLFEKLRGQAQGEKAVGQRLLLPEVVSLPPRDMAFLAEAGPILEEAGMEDRTVRRRFRRDQDHARLSVPYRGADAPPRSSCRMCGGGSRPSAAGKTRKDFYGPGLPGGRQGEPEYDRS